MIPRLLMLIVPPFIGLGAGYAFAPMADGVLPGAQSVPAMVQAGEVPNADSWSAFAADVTAEAETVAPEAPRTEEEILAGIGVFQKPVASEADGLESRLMNVGRFTTRTERDGVRRSVTVDLALEFTSHEEALKTYDSMELMRLRDAALGALVTAVQDETVHRSGYAEELVAGTMAEVIRNGIPAVERVHLIGLIVREGPARTAMLR
jgi:hypothetical protein